MDQYQRDAQASGLTLIAEAGTGHGGDFHLVVAMIEAATRTGATHVKFQHVDPAAVDNTALRPWYERCRFQRHQLENLKALVECHGLRFLCTPQTVADFQDLVEIGIDEVKISSDNAKNEALLAAVNAWGGRVYLSCGAVSEEEALLALMKLHHCTTTLMICTSEYPCPPERANLSRIKNWVIQRVEGFSDHTLGNTAALLAYGLGVRIFEKHFKIPGCSGPDMLVAASESDLTAYFAALREAEIMLGDGRW